jgi:predicted O-linked N-acetylglucosamine transferase (SPINDLY family)
MNNINKILASAVALHEAGNYSESKKLFAKILRREKNNTAALFHLATLEAQAGNFTVALSLIDRAQKNSPSSADICAVKGRVLSALERHHDAVASYEKALQINPNHPAGLLNLGCTLLLLNRSREGLEALDRLVKLMPNEPLIHHNRAIALTDLSRYDEAIASASEAIKRVPNYAEALQARGIAFGYNKHHDLAVQDFKAAYRINPNLDYLIGSLVNSQQWGCEWDGLSENKEKILAGLRVAKRVVTPFSFISMSQRPDEQLACAQIYAGSRPANTCSSVWDGKKYAHEKIRIAYLCGDFREHATSYLLAGVFEKHDRARFEISAISYGPNNPNDMLTRLKATFDQFIDVRERNDAEVTQLLKDREIDIAVDVMGYTGGARTGILAGRAAPIQVNYLAYPGTLGVNYIDYLIADPILIPSEQQKFYSERIAYLPDTYVPTDSKREISNRTFDRTELGLPPDGFVFCCFNNTYKLNPRMLDSWSRIMKKVSGSMLWLSETDATVAANIRREAGKRDIDPARLVFAKRMPLVADHLARLRLADLFLDTLPANAHTNANDSLWAGLPILTQIGDCFAARVAASLLTAIGLPELITSSQEAYEALAVELATNPGKMASINKKLAVQRLSASLFDTQRYTRHLEAAYTTIYERCHAGLAPDHFYVSKLPS